MPAPPDSKAAPGQAGTALMRLGNISVRVTYLGYYANSGRAIDAGVHITAEPLACPNCYWAQVITRTGVGQDPGGAFVDRLSSSEGPLYLVEPPFSIFDDIPFTRDGAGTLFAVTLVGNADRLQRNFQVRGAFTYGTSVNDSGVLHVQPPRVATTHEIQQALAVLRRSSPLWTIKSY